MRACGLVRPIVTVHSPWAGSTCGVLPSTLGLLHIFLDAKVLSLNWTAFLL